MTEETFSCSVIIPTRDQLALLRTCIRTVLDSPFSGRLEIIVVDNDSQLPETRQYLDELQTDERIRVISWNRPFNFSELNNVAAREASGDVLCFLNNDIEVSSPDWLERLVPLAAHPAIGVVGTLLLYPDRTVQHAGVALDSGRVAAHIGVGLPWEELRSEFLTDRLYPAEAVTAACMLTRRELFLQQGGFDEQELPVSFNDVDYCLRIASAGLPVVTYPGVQLLHHESVTRRSDDLPENRPRALRESVVMKSRWSVQLEGKRYQDGIPWFRHMSLQPQSATGAGCSTEALIRQFEADLLARQNWLDNTASSDWEERYRVLEREYRLLESHARELQKHLDTIIQGRFWRLTEPLRGLLRGMIAYKQQLGRKLVASPAGRRVYTKLRGEQAASLPEPALDPVDSKRAHAEQAARSLDVFLRNGNELRFAPAAAPEVSIILILYNQAPLTLLCLQSLIEHAGVSIELIIVDNASSDQTDALLQKVQGAKVLRNTDNRGFVEAVNQGAQEATGKYLLLLNNDALLQQNALTSAVALMESSSDIGAVGGKIILLDGSLQEAGSIIWNDGSCLGYGRGQQPEAPQFMYRRDVDYCSGAFLLTPRKLFESFNGLDMDYAPAYYEESDYCVRLHEAGYRVVYEPRAQIVHYEFASSGGFAGASVLQQKHRGILCEKHPAYLAARPDNSPSNVLRARTANRQTNLLFIDDRVPHPDLGAGYPRCREIVHALAGMGFNITFYPLLTPNDEWEQVYRTLPADVEVMLGYGQHRLEEFLRERSSFYQQIVISRNHNMQSFLDAMQAVPEFTQHSRIIYDAEAVTAPRDAAWLRLQGKPVAPETEQQMIAEEIELARIADTVITVSDAEAEFYRSAGFPRTRVLGHKAGMQPGWTDFGSRSDLLFVGAMRDDNAPNVDSLLWFASEILPVLRRLAGADIRLMVAGDNTAPALAALRNEHSIRFLGRQTDLMPLYNRCRVFIAPTRFAAGIPHKVHEAAAHGIPVVATPLLARQLGWTHENEMLVAGEAADFAAQCARLYQDEGLWWRVQTAAGAAIERDCSSAAFDAQLQSIFSV